MGNQGVNRMMRRTPKAFRDAVNAAGTLRDWEQINLDGVSPNGLIEEEEQKNNDSEDDILHTTTHHGTMTGSIHPIESAIGDGGITTGTESMMSSQIEMNQIVSKKANDTPSGNPDMEQMEVMDGNRQRIRTKSLVDLAKESVDVNGNSVVDEGDGLINDIFSMVMDLETKGQIDVDNEEQMHKRNMSVPTTHVSVDANLTDDEHEYDMP